MQKFFMIALLFWVVVPRTANGENAALTLSQAREIALRRSPLAADLVAEYAQKTAEAAQTAVFANPELDADVRIPVEWEESRGKNELELTLAQRLRASDFGTRSDVSAVMTNVAEVEREAAIFKLTKEVDLAFVRAWALQEQQRNLEMTRKAAVERARGIGAGVERGIYGEGEYRLFRGESARLEAELLGVRSDRKSSEAKLVSFLGPSTLGRALVKPDLPERLDPTEVRNKEKQSVIGASQRTKLRIELAESQLRLARRDSFPEFTPRVSLSRSDDGTTFVGVGVTLPLPISDRNESLIAQRRSELAAAGSRHAYIENGLDVEREALVEALNLSIAQARLFNDTVVPSFRDALTFQEKQFAAGSGSLVQIWQTQRELYDARTHVVELWSKAFALRTELEILIGEELSS